MPTIEADDGFRKRDWARIHRLSCGLVYDSFYDESRL
jgi:hypothetical protein